MWIPWAAWRHRAGMCFSFVACQGGLHPSASLARAAQAAVACCVFRMSCTKNTVSVYIFSLLRAGEKVLRASPGVEIWGVISQLLPSQKGTNRDIYGGGTPSGCALLGVRKCTAPGLLQAPCSRQHFLLMLFFFVARKTSVGSFSMVRVSPRWGVSSLRYFLLCYQHMSEPTVGSDRQDASDKKRTSGQGSLEKALLTLLHLCTVPRAQGGVKTGPF